MKKRLTLLVGFTFIICFILLIVNKSHLNFYKINIKDDDLAISNLSIISNSKDCYITSDLVLKSLKNESVISDVYIQIMSGNKSLYDIYTKFDNLGLNNESIIDIPNIIKNKCNIEKNKNIVINLKYKINDIEKNKSIDINLDKYVITPDIYNG